MNEEVKAFCDLDYQLYQAICEDGGLSPETIDMLIKEFETVGKVRRNWFSHISCYLRKNPSLLPRHIDYIIKEGYSSLIIGHPNFQECHIDEMIKIGKTPSDLFSSPKLLPRHIDELIIHPDYWKRRELARNPNLLQHHIDKLSKDKTLTVTRTLAYRKDLDKHHVKRLLKKADKKINNTLKNKGYI